MRGIRVAKEKSEWLRDLGERTTSIEPDQPVGAISRRWRKSIALLAIATSTTLHGQLESANKQADQQASSEVGRYHLQSNAWVNLHQRLLHEARFDTAPPAALSGEDLSRWKATVETYRKFLANRNPIFDDELIRVNAALSAMSTPELGDSIPEPAATALKRAMPLYRTVQWEKDDRVNRFWMAVATPMLASAAEELADAHEKAYGRPFPKHILVDVAPFAWEFGAYTVGQGVSAHVVISSTNAGNQGFAALEVLMHEPSHAIVDATSGAIGPDILRASHELGVKPPLNLWHAVVFYTAGELTRRALAQRGVRDYQPYIIKMYDRAFRGLRQPLEKHWQAYLDGTVSREEAIRQIVIETGSPNN
jgi:hypothetical protein